MTDNRKTAAERQLDAMNQQLRANQTAFANRKPWAAGFQSGERLSIEDLKKICEAASRDGWVAKSAEDARGYRMWFVELNGTGRLDSDWQPSIAAAVFAVCCDYLELKTKP